MDSTPDGPGAALPASLKAAARRGLGKLRLRHSPDAVTSGTEKIGVSACQVLPAGAAVPRWREGSKAEGTPTARSPGPKGLALTPTGAGRPQVQPRASPGAGSAEAPGAAGRHAATAAPHPASTTPSLQAFARCRPSASPNGLT